MISIAICSISENYLIQVKDSIAATIGIPYQLLVWDNRHENKGICEVYNLLAEEAEFEFILFLHEDILFESMSWGEQLVSLFQANPDVGVVGVAGSKYKAKAYSGWFTGIREFDCANIIHRDNKSDRQIILRPGGETYLEEVVCIDGVFICTRKKIWQMIRFDQELLKGFHFYDIDFSIRAARICSVVVMYNILLNHLTMGGDFGDKWVETSINWHIGNSARLPFTRMNPEPKFVDKRIQKTWLEVLKHQKISRINKWKWIYKQGLWKQPALLYHILKFMIYRPLGLRVIHKSIAKNG